MYRPKLLQVGVIVWLASELMFFSGLFAAFFTIRANAKVWPPPGTKLDTYQALGRIADVAGDENDARHVLGRQAAALGAKR